MNRSLDNIERLDKLDMKLEKRKDNEESVLPNKIQNSREAENITKRPLSNIIRPLSNLFSAPNCSTTA